MDSADKAANGRPANHANSPSTMRELLGAALQKHRLRRGLTQAQLAQFSGISLKYVGEIERGEANTTLEALERLAGAAGWDPLEALEGAREPITEGVRLMLISETQQLADRLKMMGQWLQAVDPARHASARLAPGPVTLLPQPPRKLVRSRARPSRRRVKPNATKRRKSPPAQTGGSQ